VANTLRIKRRASGLSTGAPSSLANAELAYNESDAGNGILYYGYGTGGAGGSATSVVAIGGDGAFVNLTGAQTISGNKTFTGTVDLSGATLSGNTTFSNNLTVTGNLTVNGTTTTVNSTTVTVDDKNIELGSTASPTDAGADGGGITLKGTTDKTFNWVDATDSWTSSEHIDLASGKEFKIAGTSVLSGSTLGSGVTGSSLTSVGTIGTGTWNGTAISVGYGGTGLTATPANGQLAIGNGTGYTLSTLTAGSNITITEGSGSITIAAAAGAPVAGDGIDVAGSTVSVDLKANGGLVIETTELAVDLGASSITGTLGVADGGTSHTSYTDGQLLIGSTTSGGLSKATLTAGSNVSITNGSGSITIASTDTNTTYTAGNGLDLAGTEFALDLKANGGLVIETTELALDLGATAITGTLAVSDGGTGATTITGLVKGNGTSAFTAAVDETDYLSPNAEIDGGTF
jgi:hypothetical protein